MKNIRATSVQFQHAPGDKASNLAKVRAFVERAAARAGGRTLDTDARL